MRPRNRTLHSQLTNEFTALVVRGIYKLEWGLSTTSVQCNQYWDCHERDLMANPRQYSPHPATGGFVPKRDVYLCLGHDEEIGGSAGALEIARALASQGVSFEFMLDEGLMIVDGTRRDPNRRVLMVVVPNIPC